MIRISRQVAREALLAVRTRATSERRLFKL
jgi:hypothetical protein